MMFLNCGARFIFSFMIHHRPERSTRPTGVNAPCRPLALDVRIAYLQKRQRKNIKMTKYSSVSYHLYLLYPHGSHNTEHYQQLEVLSLHLCTCYTVTSHRHRCECFPFNSLLTLLFYYKQLVQGTSGGNVLYFP